MFPLPEFLSCFATWVWAHPHLVLPLFFSILMAWTDLRSNRIPNYLNLTCALAGLGYQLGADGLNGLGHGLLGLALGFTLMIVFYLWGGMGAGDVKALAALGTWLGPWHTLFLFVYMSLSGLPLIVIFLWYRGQLGSKLRQGWASLANLIRSRSRAGEKPREGQLSPDESLPYAVAIALGMALLCFSTALSKTLSQ